MNFVKKFTFTDYLGNDHTIGMNSIISCHTDGTPVVTGRISGIYLDGKDVWKIRLWWTNNYSNNEFELDDFFNQEHIRDHHITKTNTIVLRDGVDTTAQLGENLSQILSRMKP